MSGDPTAEYRTRLDQRRSTFDTLNRTDARLAAGRLVVFGLGVVVAILTWRAAVSPWWLLGPLVAFAALAVRHDRVIRARERAAKAVVFYDDGLARLDDSWPGRGATGEAFRDPQHPYAEDLDLFGHGSLFQLLSIARTPAGESTLADWLKRAADPTEVVSRQEAVRELTSALDLREDMAVATSPVRRRVDASALCDWAEAPLVLGAHIRVAALGVTSVTLAAATWALVSGNATPLLVMLGLQSGFALPLERRCRTILHGADGPARALTALQPALQRLERETFTAPRLQAVRRLIDERGAKASAAVSALNRLVEMHDWQHNVIFAPLALALMWGTHLASAIEAWKRQHGGHVRAWMDAVGQFEALSSLGAYAYEHPADPYPVLTPRQADEPRTSATFAATGLGHPLIPQAKMVRNDVHLGQPARMLLISGSNMSGKSTLLRTVGVNCVLAQIGAPVRASALTLSPLLVGATLRIQDSLQEGRSRFYAEITRVRQLADLSRGPVPLLFLLDELFHGTNSHDRLAGASGVLRSLLANGAIGLVTTHDLALTSMAAEVGEAAVNVHFEDWFDGDEMRFDYRMKPGPVTRSNALALMRAVGLDVSER